MSRLVLVCKDKLSRAQDVEDTSACFERSVECTVTLLTSVSPLANWFGGRGGDVGVLLEWCRGVDVGLLLLLQLRGRVDFDGLRDSVLLVLSIRLSTIRLPKVVFEKRGV